MYICGWICHISAWAFCLWIWKMWLHQCLIAKISAYFSVFLLNHDRYHTENITYIKFQTDIFWWKSYLCFSFSTVNLYIWVRSIFVVNKHLLLCLSQHYGCWCSGDTRNQGQKQSTRSWLRYDSVILISQLHSTNADHDQLIRSRKYETK